MPLAWLDELSPPHPWRGWSDRRGAGARHKGERWWRRPEERVIAPTHADREGRAITDRMLAMLFARDDDVRRRFMVNDVSDEWQRGLFVGNWIFRLTPGEAVRR
jgi:hypothetical protein